MPIALFQDRGPSEWEIATDRLKLRSLRRGDARDLHDAIEETLPDLIRWLPWARPGHSLIDTRYYIRNARTLRDRRAAFEFVAREEASQTLVAITSLHRIDWTRRAAGLGYWVRSSGSGRGIATEAAGAIVDYGFRVLRLHRIEAHVATENPKSQRVVEKLG